MAQTSITLTASMRSNLSSLKTIQSQMDKTQEKLSTGKKVNSAIDNASSYYQSRALTNRAADLEGLLDSMGQGIQTIQAANEGIEAVTAFVEQLKSIANSAYALDTSDQAAYDTSIASYTAQYNQILTEIGNVVEDASYQGVNLLNGGDLKLTFNETRSNDFTIDGKNIINEMNLGTTNGWTSADVKRTENVTVLADKEVATGVTVSKGATVYTDGQESPTYYVQGSDNKYYTYQVSGTTETFGTTGSDKTGLTALTKEVDTGVDSYAASIDQTLTKLSEAVDKLRSYSTELGNNYSVIETRQDFTEAMIDVLETGADDLVLADMNEESANYLALQTRQQLAVNSLSLASQSAQSVLSLF